MPTPEDRKWRRKVFWLALVVFLAASCLTAGGSYYYVQKTTDEVAHDHNALVCGFRKYVIPSRARAVQAKDDKSTSASARKRAENSIATADDLLSFLLTKPRGYDCSRIHR